MWECVVILARMQIAVFVLALGTGFAACQGRFAEPRDPCDGVDCSGHGRCFVDGEEAFCRCDDGFDDDGLECVAESADGDADVDSDADSDSDNEDCVPDCGDRECGVDPVCGTMTCGECDDTLLCTEEGRCGCIRDCGGRECGTDGCGGMCPPGCAVGQICDERSGECECVPDCDGRDCGSDGCGGSCPPGCGDRRVCDDGFCGPVCEDDRGWGNACSGEENCDDDSICQSYPALEGHGSFCSPRCSSDDLCPDIAPGREICSWGFCLIECSSSAECPCDMECRDLMGVQMICYP